jgi:hypothetical protein
MKKTLAGGWHAAVGRSTPFPASDPSSHPSRARAQGCCSLLPHADRAFELRWRPQAAMASAGSGGGASGRGATQTSASSRSLRARRAPGARLPARPPEMTGLWTSGSWRVRETCAGARTCRGRRPAPPLHPTPLPPWEAAAAAPLRPPAMHRARPTSRPPLPPPRSLTGQSNTVGYNSIDGQPMPELAQPMPGRVLAFGPDGAWGDAQPSIHYGARRRRRCCCRGDPRARPAAEGGTPGCWPGPSRLPACLPACLMWVQGRGGGHGR